ncbi:hypothetical protein GCM10010116_35030 [Microbispora rosea subsp. aerata]|nr:hypothetical protein [Microbispora rosea]GGO17334.1 hypothetical protein GCM10010116_35030 [Microbispora rosea subsp. aerata]GIH56517.1 hypothetical protein Mro02_34310 [Microbispora rosea subsp. aerata]GLJ81953.1 hypothetical protein GCM10017588_06780 [Microbispora rosea subsp. aerata]
MGDFVGVDPDNLKELTKRLEQLHELLARHSPLIQQKMQKWGSEVALTSLPGLIAAALDDVRDMDARTTRAYELAREQGWSALGRTPGIPGLTFNRPPTVRLDWEATGQSGNQGKRDAQALTAALAAKNPEDARTTLLELSESLRRHLADKDHQAAFWAEAGPLALRAARALYERSGSTLFSAESVSVLRALGASLAAASQMRVGTGKDRRPLLSAATRAALTGNSDPWSVGMLVKFGPEGKSWDSHLLADLTRAMLDARAAGKEIWPPARGKLETEADASRHQQLMAEYDAVGAVLQRAAENGMAARHVLGDQATGLKYARMLVDDSWHTPGYDPGPFLSSYVHPGGTLPPTGQMDLSAPTAAFLKAAVSAERGTSADAKESAWSVVHIVQATAEFATANTERVLPTAIRASLTYMAARYLPDFAMSAGRPYGSGVIPLGNQDGNPWVAIADGSHLELFFPQALRGAKEYATFKALMDTRVSAAVAATVKDPSDADYLSEMAGLYGLVERTQADQNFAEHSRQDEQAERNQMLLAMFTGGFGALNFEKTWGPGVMAQFLTGAGAPILDKAIDTDHKWKALQDNAASFRKQVLHVELPVVQGLIDAGVLHPPENATWFVNGRLRPDASFTSWLSRHAETRYGGRRLEDWIKEAQLAMRLQQ